MVTSNILNKSVLFLLFSLINFGLATAQHNLSGQVLSHQGDILIGATVRIEPSHLVLSTNANGQFEVKDLKDEECLLSVSYIGYHTYKTMLQLTQKENQVTIKLDEADILTEDVIVSATRAGNRTPMAYTNIDLTNLADKNSGQDLPYLLSMTPSLVTTSDAGTGIGYTNFRIRGSDANRINMSVNGVPLNDAESHSVYFVDLPDFASSTGNIQVQRGVGTSTNGAGAFGGTVNIQTNNLDQKSFAKWSTAGGSFHTLKNTVMVGSGLINGKVIVEARLSKITSDGFVDRAASDLKSFYLSAGYFTEHSLFKLLFFSGKEKTYQSWNGVPSSLLESNRRYNPSGIIYGPNGELSYYDNETDNYQQDHYQFHYSNQINSYLSANFSIHYTYGRGYYEEYRQNQNLLDYGMQPLIIRDSTLSQTDLIRQKWLDNDFYGGVASLSYKKEKIELVIGSSWNQYSGSNYGKVIWAKYYGNLSVNHEWYRSNGDKSDYNFFSKCNYQLSEKISIYGDLQYRHINYRIEGRDDNQRDLCQKHLFDFFNPKAGAFYTINDRQNIYFSYGNAHREPNRSNYTDADPTRPVPRQEKLHDFEFGYQNRSNHYQFGINLYDMIYRDQLILTGEINDVGAAIMTNVPKSYRAGVEFTGKLTSIKNITWDHNLTLSNNKIKEFTEYVDDWDSGKQRINLLGTTDISFSPSITAGSLISWQLLKGLKISLQSLYVSRQFIDNSANSDRQLNAYFVNNLKFEYNFKQKHFSKWSFYANINNLLDQKYESNAWVYSYYLEGKRQKEDGYFPQAGASFLLGMQIEF